MIRDILTDIVSHIQPLGNISQMKITGTESSTVMNSFSDDRTVVFDAKTHVPVEEFIGVFGLPNIDKLHAQLKNPEYKDTGVISIRHSVRNGESSPSSIHFMNASGDYQNEFRLQCAELANETNKMKVLYTPKWDIVFEPSVLAISRLKSQPSYNSVFSVKTEDNNLVFYFGSANTHSGSFVFQNNVNVNLPTSWSWNVKLVQSILNLDGKITMKLSVNSSAMLITIDSGLAEYNYTLPALKDRAGKS